MSAAPTTTATDTAPAQGGTAGSLSARVLLWLSSRGVFLFTAALVVFAAVFVDGFASFANLTDVFYRAAPIGIVAVGMTFVVISGNYLDLSVVAQVATAAVILIAVSNAVGIALAVLAALAVAMVYGLVNGIAVGYFKANAVIVTLSTTYIGLGILRWLSGGSIFFGPQDGPIRALGQVEVLGLPLSAVVLVVMAGLLAFVLDRTNFGFTVRAFGSNKEATRLAGVNTPRVVVGAFLITSVAAAVSGFVLAAFSNTAVSTMATGFDFGALAAIIIGGTSVFGGRGSILRTLLGVIFVSVLTNVLVLSGVGFGWQQMAIGLLIVAAVSLDTLARKVATS
jgi:ribose transport system permease protein